MKKSKKQEIKQKSPSSMIKSPSKEKLSLIKRLKNWITSNIYNIYYIILLILLWGYIIMHWDLCITMQFFSHFDGNNILFIVGIILVVLPLYNIEGKGIKIGRKTRIEMEQKLEETDITYDKEKRINILQSNNDANKKSGGNG